MSNKDICDPKKEARIQLLLEQNAYSEPYLRSCTFKILGQLIYNSQRVVAEAARRYRYYKTQTKVPV